MHVPAEQLAAALRHLGWTVLPPEPCLERGGLRLRGRVASYEGREVLLTLHQARLLALLLAAWPDPLRSADAREALVGPVWEGLQNPASAVRNHVASLRALLGCDLIETVQGVGYVLVLGIGGGP